MNLLPLCTAKVCPTKSGSTVLARDHVLITFLEPAAFCDSTFFTRASWTNGPFLTLLAIVSIPDYCVALPRFRPRTIIRCDGFFLLRVFTPSFLPHGLTTFRPPRVLPPCGWSTGFMTSPRTFGRLPIQRLFPAFPHDSSACSALPTSPIVARQRWCTRRTSELGMRRVTYSPSFAITCADIPADRQICPPFPTLSSMLCTAVPSGISPSGSALPSRTSVPGPDAITSPTLSPFG